MKNFQDQIRGMTAIDTHIALLAQLVALTKQLVASQLTQTNVSQIQILGCDFCGGEHLNGNCVPNMENAKVQYTNFHINNMYSNT